MIEPSFADDKGDAAATNHPAAVVVLGQTRVRDASGYIGTIAYQGPVASSKTVHRIYYGVIWDDPSRGKHNGSVVCARTNRLISHFHCAHATGASFLLPHKADFGRALTLDVLLERYEEECSELEQHTVRTSRGMTKPIEFVGYEKILEQQQVDRLDSVSLRRMGINSMALQSNERIQHLEQIDLGANLLYDWAHVQVLLDSFPLLSNLSLASNRMVADSSGWLRSGAQSYPQLLRLNVRGAITSWETVTQLAHVLPNLQELCLAFAKLDDLIPDVQETPDVVFEHLQLLDVTGCHLDETRVVQILKYVPNIESLSVDENPISCWPRMTTTLPNLQHLQLAHTNIQDWTDLEILNCKEKLPALSSLRIRHCPLLKDLGELQARSLILARLPRLIKLNASAVSPNERQEAERHYILSVGRELQNAGALAVGNGLNENQDNTANIIISNHPQYTYLLGKHPELAAQVAATRDSNLNGSVLADSIVNVQIRSLAAQSCTVDPLIRRLPGKLTVGRLKALCARHFGLDIDLQTLSFCSQGSSLPTPMPDDDRSLSYYGVGDGSDIMMNEMDIQSLKRERERARQVMADRLEQQEKELNDFQLQKEQASRHMQVLPIRQGTQ
jgi:hypothetical protein